MRAQLAAPLAAAFVLGFAAPAGATPGPANAPEYWFDQWKVSQLWQSGARGEGIVIGEIDTGVNAALPQLSGRVLKGHDFGDSGGDGRTDRDVEQFGHGTAMASIMVGRPGPFGITGLAPDAKVLPIAVPLTGTTDAQSEDDLPAAIRYAADHGADVINMSLGGKRHPGEDNHACPPDEQSAIYHALSKGVILVAAAGNTGPLHNTVEEPGVCLGVISVGAVDATGTVASFSSRQPYLTVSAPGVNVPSLGRIPGSGYSGDGTSQAAAIVSAVLALTWSAHRSLSSRDIVTRLLNTLDASRRTRSPDYGYGIVDGYRAVTAAVSSSAPNPVYSAVAPFLARERAFAAQGKARPPKPAATKPLGAGGYDVSGAPQLAVAQVVVGLTVAAAGLLALVSLLVIGRRRARQYALAASVAPARPPGVPTYLPPPVWAPPAEAWPAPSQAPRPRPLPGPRPEPGHPPLSDGF